MRFCSSVAWTALALCAASGSAFAEPVHRASLVVRADQRSGRLVRRVVVAPQAVRQVVVEPRMVAPVVPSRSSAAPGKSLLQDYAEQAARRYEVDPLLVHSVIQVESNYDPYAISPKGARGLMQLMPSTARRFQVANSFDPWQSIDGGVRYLRYLLTLFGSERLAVAAYNAGEGAVFRYGNVPPFPETVQYVRRLGARYGAAQVAGRKSEPAPPKTGSRPAHPPILEFTDAQGKVHYQTRSGL